MNTSKIVPILLVLILLTSACAERDQLSIHDAWARPGFRGDNSAIYLIIQNQSAVEDGLIGASTDIAGVTEIHLSRMDEAATMTMERQDLVDIPAGSTVDLSPGGLHVMLVNLSKDLSAGDIFPLTLEFQRAGDITVEVEVKQP